MTQLAAVGNDVWVGDHGACNQHGPRFALTIHIWHPYQQGKWLCDHVRSGRDDQLVLQYSDGQSLGTASVPVSEIAEYARQPGKLLAHCAFGTYRGPTLAVLAKVARGCDPFDALADVARGMWTWYGSRQVPFLNSVPVREIIEWAQAGG